MNDKDLSNLNPFQLQDLIKRGIVRVMLPTSIDLDTMTKFDQPEYQEHAYLKGIPISISAASRKYGINLSTISRWTKNGYIQVVGRDKNRVLVDEADVAYCVEILKANPGARKWIFNPDGTPYVKKTC